MTAHQALQAIGGGIIPKAIPEDTRDWGYHTRMDAVYEWKGYGGV